MVLGWLVYFPLYPWNKLFYKNVVLLVSLFKKIWPLLRKCLAQPPFGFTFGSSVVGIEFVDLFLLLLRPIRCKRETGFFWFLLVLRPIRHKRDNNIFTLNKIFDNKINFFFIGIVRCYQCFVVWSQDPLLLIDTFEERSNKSKRVLHRLFIIYFFDHVFLNKFNGGANNYFMKGP